jgi:cytochrome c peroxidase
MAGSAFGRGRRARPLVALAAAALGIGLGAVALARDSALPPGTDFGDAATALPREIFASEAAGGRQSDLAALGNLLFGSPDIFGEPARSAGISCETCHTAGHANAHFFIPGLSQRPGTIDVSNGFFNPPADDHVFNPVRIPSLRGIRYLAPYGRDGRIASLREFARGVIVVEFGGPEPSPRVLDALVSYMQEIDFLPNPRLGPAGTLVGLVSGAERRGAALFQKPFAGMGGQSCAGCHPPSALFTDHGQHDVASGGIYKTPTLLGLDYRAPYFHDGRYATLPEAVAHFDRAFALGLSRRDVADLVAYLRAVGDASEPEQPDSVASRMTEIETFCSTLDRLVAARDPAMLRLAVNTINRELRELGEQFPGRELKPARSATAALAVELRAIEAIAKEQGPDAAEARLAEFQIGIGDLGPTLEAFEAQSLFNPARRSAHYASLKAVEVLRGE